MKINNLVDIAQVALVTHYQIICLSVIGNTALLTCDQLTTNNSLISLKIKLNYNLLDSPVNERDCVSLLFNLD